MNNQNFYELDRWETMNALRHEELAECPNPHGLTAGSMLDPFLNSTIPKIGKEIFSWVNHEAYEKTKPDPAVTLPGFASGYISEFEQYRNSEPRFFPVKTENNIELRWLDNHQDFQAPQTTLIEAPQEAPNQNINKLLMIAAPLLTLMTTIRHTIDQKDVPRFREQIIEEIKYFEQSLQSANYAHRLIFAARYCLSTALDEAVLSRDWGTESVWTQGSLLSHFHKETWGGERFYIIIEEMAKDPRSNIDFLEFAYCLLSLGFEGKFYDNLTAVREDIRNRIFQRIRFCRHKPDKLLSPHACDETFHPAFAGKKKWSRKWLVIMLVFIASVLIVFNIKASIASKNVMAELSGIGNVSPVTVFSNIIGRPLIERESEE